MRVRFQDDMIRQSSSWEARNLSRRKQSRVPKTNKSIGAQAKTAEMFSGTTSGELTQVDGHDLDDIEAAVASLSYENYEAIINNASVERGGLELMTYFDSSATESPLVIRYDSPRLPQTPTAAISAVEVFLLQHCK